MPWPTCACGSRNCGGIFDYDVKRQRLDEVSRQLEEPDVWADAKRAQELGREKKSLDDVVVALDDLHARLGDGAELFEMARDEDDDGTLLSVDCEG